MNKHIIIGAFLLSILILFSNLSLAETTEIKDTSIDYISYREIVVGEPGVIYQIKITNIGTRERDYEVVPDTDIIRNLGTYRIDPSDKITLKPNEQKTIYFYLAVEKELAGRTIIPVEIRTGLEEKTLDLVARPIGPFQEPLQESAFLITAFKVVLIIILVIIIILALIFSFRKMKVRKEEGEESKHEFDEDIETYY